MSIFRKPKGTYTRSTPDWFSQKAAAGFGFCSAAVGITQAVGLFNDANDGSKLFVYGFGADVYADIEVNFNLFNDPMVQVYSRGFPIEGGSPAPYGSIRIGFSSVIPQTGMYITGGQGNAGISPYVAPIFSDYPLAIVRTGWCFAAYVEAAVGMGAFFHYVVMPF
jgi:hypothetical protein